jgi:hypothetical protein
MNDDGMESTSTATETAAAIPSHDASLPAVLPFPFNPNDLSEDRRAGKVMSLRHNILVTQAD